MKKQIIYSYFYILIMVICCPLISFAGTYEEAQHRLPPVIYSLDIPQTVEANKAYEFNWSVMGYHEDYDIIISVYNSSKSKIATKTVSSWKEEEGQYSWGVRSRRFYYSTNLNLPFSDSQELTIRFFASPINDPVDNSFLSCIVPGGLGYKAGDTTGRKIKIYGVSNDSLELNVGTGNYFAGAVENTFLKTEKSYRGFNSAFVKIFSRGEGSRLTITFFPQFDQQNEGYAYKVVLPWEIPISSFYINNAIKPSEDAEYKTLAVIRDEIIGKLLGVFSFPVSLFMASTETVGDPAFASYIEDSDIISKKVYPYQTFQGVFEREHKTVSTQFVIDSNMTLGEVLQILKQYKMSFYIGGSPGNELFVEGLAVK